MTERYYNFSGGSTYFQEDDFNGTLQGFLEALRERTPSQIHHRDISFHLDESSEEAYFCLSWDEPCPEKRAAMKIEQDLKTLQRARNELVHWQSMQEKAQNIIDTLIEEYPAHAS